MGPATVDGMHRAALADRTVGVGLHAAWSAGIPVEGRTWGNFSN